MEVGGAPGRPAAAVAPTVGLDPFDPAFDRAPGPVWDRLLASGPHVLWEETGLWIVVGHDEVTEILRDDARFTLSSDFWAGVDPQDAPTAVDLLRRSSLMALGPDDHTRVRRLVSTAMTPRAVTRMRAVTQSIVDELIDGLDPDRPVDLVSEYAADIPSNVMSVVLGVPETARGDFKAFADILIRVSNPFLAGPDMDLVNATVPLFRELLGSLLDSRRAEPRDDMLTDLIRAGEDEDRLNEDELLALVAALIIAGSETTQHAIVLGTRHLVEDEPDWAGRWRENPAVGSRVVDEILRACPIGKWVIRFAASAGDFHGIPLEAGQMLLVSIAAANRDPARIENPARFDPLRDQGSALPFGLGRHYCLGAALARMELDVAIGSLLRRCPHLAAEGPMTFRPHFVLHEITSAPFRMGPLRLGR